MPEDERDAEIQRRIKAESECPFDLSAGQLLRSTLLRARRPRACADPDDAPQRFRRLVDGNTDARALDALRSVFEWETVAVRASTGAVLGLRGVAA